jgi:hypothetical protein
MENQDVEWDAIVPRPANTAYNYDSAVISSESSESVSEGASLLGIDNKQIGNYKSTEIVGSGDDVVVESESTLQEQNTPKAIAAVIGVLLVGNISYKMALETG